MSEITKKEEGTFLMLFNRNGYVLNFSTADFDVFTTNSIGVALCNKYGLSKGKSLIAYLNSATYSEREKLLLDLFHYYEDNMQHEYDKDYENFFCYNGYDERYARIYQKCKGIVERIEGTSSVISQTADNLKRKFSSEYMTQQIELMVSMQATNPTNATLDALNLLPSNIQSTDQGADAIKAILGNLRAIPSKLAEIRNPFGSGHGKSASFKGLEERHAKLAVGSSITFVDFVWSTYENQKQTGQKII